MHYSIANSMKKKMSLESRLTEVENSLQVLMNERKNKAGQKIGSALTWALLCEKVIRVVKGFLNDISTG